MVKNFKGAVSHSCERATHRVLGGIVYQVAVEKLGKRVNVRAGGCQDLSGEKESLRLCVWAIRG
jgi:hypothetical protein